MCLDYTPTNPTPAQKSIYGTLQETLTVEFSQYFGTNQFQIVNQFLFSQFTNAAPAGITFGTPSVLLDGAIIKWAHVNSPV